MVTLYHHPFCPHSRFVRVASAEYGHRARADRRKGLGAAARVPAAVARGDRRRSCSKTAFPPIPGRGRHRGISRRDARGAFGDRRLLPDDDEARVEARRLRHWFNCKFFSEVSQWLVEEKIYKRFRPSTTAAARPDMDAVRAARANLRYHLQYIGRLIATREVARGRSAHLRRSGGGGAPVLRGLSGRRAVERERDRKGLVREGEVAAVVPSAAGRAAAGDGAEPDLRRSRFLSRLRFARARTRI